MTGESLSWYFLCFYFLFFIWQVGKFLFFRNCFEQIVMSSFDIVQKVTLETANKHL